MLRVLLAHMKPYKLAQFQHARLLESPLAVILSIVTLMLVLRHDNAALVCGLASLPVTLILYMFFLTTNELL